MVLRAATPAELPFWLDRLRTDDSDRLDWRVFFSPRGNMKLAALEDVVDEDQAQLFATRTARSVWSEQRAPESLDLWPCSGKKHNTPCDDGWASSHTRVAAIGHLGFLGRRSWRASKASRHEGQLEWAKSEAHAARGRLAFQAL